MIGAGRVGTAVAVLLQRAGYRVVAASGGLLSEERTRQHLAFTRFHAPEEAHEAARSARLVLIGVPDDRIERVCGQLASRVAFHRGQVVLHLSGSVGLDALETARMLGADVLSLHPLQSFPSVESGVRRLPGSAVAVTARDEAGYRLGEVLARDLAAIPFRLADEAKPLYHAAAVFCSNYLVAVEAVAEHLFHLAGLEDPIPLFGPLATATLTVTLAGGPREALTGPAVRGDVGTVGRNLEALKEHAPQAIPAYVALARVAGDLGVSAGRLSVQDRRRLEEVLANWT